MTDDPIPPQAISGDPALAGFLIERELAGGGMSRLFVASDRKFQRRVVIKVLVPTDARSLSIERFRREISVATSLQHPNIVPILSAGELEAAGSGIPFLVMPYVEGESLRDRLLRGPLSIREAVHIARDVARALGFAHGMGIVHRDIKPGNILLSAGAAVVSDFGVAKAITSSRQGSGTSGERALRPMHRSLTAIGTSLGTPAYMAPEQAAADPNVDHRADIYALGIVLYEMLTGTPPFHGRSPQELLRAQLADPPPPLASRRYDVPRRLADLVTQCLEKDPERRPRSANDVLRWLDDPEVLSGDYAGATSWTGSGGGKRRLRAGLFAGGALAFIATALYFGGTWAAEPAETAVRTTAPREWQRRLSVGPLTVIGESARTPAMTSLVAGLSSEITNVMATVPGFHVRAATTPGDSAAAASPTEPTLRVEGTVQRERAQLRVLLRAVDTPGDSVLWTGAFDGHADSVLFLQDRVARSVASALATISAVRNTPPP